MSCVMLLSVLRLESVSAREGAIFKVSLTASLIESSFSFLNMGLGASVSYEDLIPSSLSMFLWIFSKRSEMGFLLGMQLFLILLLIIAASLKVLISSRVTSGISFLNSPRTCLTIPYSWTRVESLFLLSRKLADFQILTSRSRVNPTIDGWILNPPYSMKSLSKPLTTFVMSSASQSLVVFHNQLNLWVTDSKYTLIEYFSSTPPSREKSSQPTTPTTFQCLILSLLVQAALSCSETSEMVYSQMSLHECLCLRRLKLFLDSRSCQSARLKRDYIQWIIDYRHRGIASLNRQRRVLGNTLEITVLVSATFAWVLSGIPVC